MSQDSQNYMKTVKCAKLQKKVGNFAKLHKDCAKTAKLCKSNITK